MWALTIASIVQSAFLLGAAVSIGCALAPRVQLHAPMFEALTRGSDAFGIVAGYLYWRFGLDAAIVAHMTAHLLNYVLNGQDAGDDDDIRLSQSRARNAGGRGKGAHEAS